MTEFPETSEDKKSAIKSEAYTVGDLMRDLAKFPSDTPIVKLSDYEMFPVRKRGEGINLRYCPSDKLMYHNEWHEVRWLEASTYPYTMPLENMND